VQALIKVKYGSTPLHIVARNGYLEIVEVLLKWGADIDSQDERGRIALNIASGEGLDRVFKSLLEHVSDINITYKTGIGLCYPLAGVIPFYNEINSYDSDYNVDYGCDSDDYYYHGSDDYEHDCDDDYFQNRHHYHDSDDVYYHHHRNIGKSKIIAEILKCRIIKMKIVNLFVSEENLRSISSDEKSDFQNECEEETASVKSEKVSNANVSFYDILTKDIGQLAMYAGNENIVQIYRSDDYKVKFPIYASLINSNFRKGERRKEFYVHFMKEFWNKVIRYSIFSLTASLGYHMTVLKEYLVT